MIRFISGTAFIHAWAKFCVKQRLLILLLSLLFLFPMALSLSKIGFVWTFEMWFQQGDKQLNIFEEFKDTFGESQYLLIGVEATNGKTVLEPETLQTIHLLTEFLEAHRFVEEVDSLANYQYITSADDLISIRNLIEDPLAILELPQPELDYMAKVLKSEELIQGVLVNRELRDTIISARMVYKQGVFDHHVALVQELREFIKSEALPKGDYKLHFSGLPAVYEQYMSLSQADLSLAIPLIFGIAIVLLVFIFRTVPGVVLPLIVIVTSIISTLGIMVMMGWNMTSVNTYLPLMMLIVGMCDSLHILVEFYSHRRKNLTPREAAQKAIENMFVPCFFTSITTSLGFMALYMSNMPPIQEFGFAAAFGVIVAFVFSVTLLPVLLTFVKKIPKQRKNPASSDTQDSGIMNWSVSLAGNNSKKIALAGGFLALVSLYFVFQVQVDSNYIKSFSHKTQLRQDMEYFNEKFHGVLNMELVIDSGAANGVNNPVFLRRVHSLQKDLQALESVGRITSVVKYIMRMNQVLHNDEVEYYRLPKTSDHVAQYLFLYRNSGPRDDLSSLRSFDGRYLRVQLHIPILSTTDTNALLDGVRELLQSGYSDLDVVITGENFLVNHLNSYIEGGIVGSFGMALLTIVVCIMLLLRSVVFSTLAVVSSVFPILLVGGIIGIAGIYLDMTNMIVAAMTFGIAVDDSIHVTLKYMRERKTGILPANALSRAVNSVGVAVMFSSVILFFGFSVMLMSSFIPFIYFGFLSALIILFALLSAVVLNPALIMIYERLANKASIKSSH